MQGAKINAHEVSDGSCILTGGFSISVKKIGANIQITIDINGADFGDFDPTTIKDNEVLLPLSDDEVKLHNQQRVGFVRREPASPELNLVGFSIGFKTNAGGKVGGPGPSL